MVPSILAAHLNEVGFLSYLRHHKTDGFFLLPLLFLFFRYEGPQGLLFIAAKRFLEQNFIRHKLKGFEIIFFEHSCLQLGVALPGNIVHIDALRSKQFALPNFEDDAAPILLSGSNSKNIPVEAVTRHHLLPFSIAFQALKLRFNLCCLLELQLPGKELHALGERAYHAGCLALQEAGNFSDHPEILLFRLQAFTRSLAFVDVVVEADLVFF